MLLSGHMYNFLFVNIMDTIPVTRSFSIRSSEKDGVVASFLHMYSTTSGEFGFVTLECAAFLDYTPGMDLQCHIIKDSGELPMTLFGFRHQELSFFLTILTLFNPVNQKYYEEQKSSSPESPEF